jgi:Ca-activated chloride channel homolog
MAFGVKKGSILLASLLFGTFGVHAMYRAQAKSPMTGGSAETAANADAPVAGLRAAIAGLGEAPGATTRLEASDGTVHLTATADRRAVLQNGDGVVHVEVSVKADAVAGTSEPAPTDLVVVLDRSGSMDGQKLDYAKQALLGLIERVGPADRLGVVTFDDSAAVLFPPESPTGSARDRWRALVRSVAIGGGTNIRDGLDAGMRLLLERSQQRVTRVLLLSDGQDTGGNSFETLVGRARAIGSKQAVLSTLGIGQDFDERVMTALASAGTGAFYYLAKLEVLPGMLDAELKTATQTYASGAELRLRTGDGVQVSSAGGMPLERRGEELVVPIGSLYAARERKVWLTLHVPTEGLSEHALGELALRYRRSGEEVEVRAAALPKVACLASQDRFEAEIDADVWGRAMLEEELTRAREELGDAIARGTAKDVDSSVVRVEQQRALAARLGQLAVVKELNVLQSEGDGAKRAQQAAPAERNAAAKRSKAIGYGKRNTSSYAGSDWASGF